MTLIHLKYVQIGYKLNQNTDLVNKFENNNPIMKPSGGLNRDEQKSISAENIMKKNIQANLN